MKAGISKLLQNESVLSFCSSILAIICGLLIGLIILPTKPGLLISALDLLSVVWLLELTLLVRSESCIVLYHLLLIRIFIRTENSKGSHVIGFYHRVAQSGVFCIRVRERIKKGICVL